MGEVDASHGQDDGEDRDDREARAGLDDPGGYTAGRSERRSTPGPATGKGAQTRSSILEAAIARFGRDGYRATSVADIARDAGVGSTITYAYFPNKEALFLAALDEDAAAVIHESLSFVFDDTEPKEWRASLLFTLVDAVERHPLARRVLAGLEPTVTDHVVEVPAMAELRKAVAERMRADQLAGTVRLDVDPVAIANGTITIILSLVMSVLQVGPAAARAYGPDIMAVFEAALDPPASPPAPVRRSR